MLPRILSEYEYFPVILSEASLYNSFIYGFNNTKSGQFYTLSYTLSFIYDYTIAHRRGGLKVGSKDIEFIILHLT